jgi:hypothetical protein
VILLSRSLTRPLISSLSFFERGESFMPTDTASGMPRSVVRHRPVMPDVQTQIQTPRASRARQMPEPQTDDLVPTKAQRPRRLSWLVYLVLGMLCACLLLWIGQMLLHWGNTVADDIRYGRPRTTQIDHFVGHEVGKTPSHFIATNINGQVYIVEIPGGQANNAHLLIGPHLVGEGADLAPISLSFPGDPQHPDLLMTVDGIQVRFHNTGSTYVPES